MKRKHDQVRTVFGMLIPNQKDACDQDDELLLARIADSRRRLSDAARYAKERKAA